MRHHDLVVIGTGSGNTIVDDAFADLDVGIVEHGSFGGTCVNVTVMRLPEVPRRLAILGGSYIAAEFAHIFGALGAEVTIIDKADRLLGPQDETVAERFTELARGRYDVRSGREVAEIAAAGDGVALTLDDGAVVEADTVLVAVGRVTNADGLDLDKGGVEVTDTGSIVVDGHQRTTADGVWALGDISTAIQLKHVANREAKVVAHNLLHPEDLWETDHSAIPSAIFTAPQIASVGATEQECRDEGLDYVTSTTPYSDTAYGWALQDEDGFCKVLAERGTGRLLGAHIMGPDASILVQPLVLAMALGIDATTVATRPYWIHPALTEVVENTLLGLDL